MNARQCFLILIAVAFFSACGGQKSAGLQEGAVAPDTTLFENGMKYLEKSQYIKARLSFQTLINTYPDSEFTPTAFLGIADSYYEEGGSENLLQAEAQYKDFLIFYPNHEMADDAQLKIAAINFRMMKPADRDQTYAKKAEAEFEKFLENFPDSELAPTAREFLYDVEETRAQSIYSVGDFYFNKKSWLAAESRFKEVLEDYPEFSKADGTLYKLGTSLEKMGRIDEAAVYYHRLAAEYPFSPYFGESRDKLILLERPVPEINEQAAARHEANRREEDFSFLDPIRSVFNVFTGRPDPYEIARKRAQQRQVADGSPESAEGKSPQD